MTWLPVTLLLIASACMTLTAIHAHVWFRQRELRPNAAFAVLASSVAAMAFVELRMAHADTVEAFGRALWWYHVPVWLGLVAVVCFVRLFLDAGRAWLGWTAIGLRTLALVINALSTPSINYREITRWKRSRYSATRLPWSGASPIPGWRSPSSRSWCSSRSSPTLHGPSGGGASGDAP